MEDVSLTEPESRYFSDLFVCCDVEKTGKVPMLKATELFRSANLAKDVIRDITSLAGIPQTALHISRTQFYSCLKLIAAYQASIPLRAELIASSINLPLPRFSWKESPPMSSSSRKNSTTSCVSVSSACGLHVVVVDTNGLSNAAAEPRLELDTTNSDVPSTDSEVEHNELAVGRRRNRDGSPEAWSTNSDSPTPTNSVAERPWAKDNHWQGLLGDEHRQLLGTEEESSDRHSSDEDNESDLDTVFQITAEQREYYHKQFKAVQPDGNGLLSGHTARVFFEKSRIPVEELRHIWQLCDVTKDGALSLAEFTAAMHLVVLRRNNIPLPPVLPSCLHPGMLVLAIQPTEPPEADLLHLNDEEDKADMINNLRGNVKQSLGVLETDFKRIVPRPDKNAMNLSTLSATSQTSTSSKHTGNNSSSPPIAVKNRSVSSSPPAEPTISPMTKEKEIAKDWSNQSREWTKFTESPTSNVSSPGPKPVNFDMQRTAQAVVSDPQILHPVPLRVTPVGAEANIDDDASRLLRKSDNQCQRENDTSPKQTHQQPSNNSQHHRDSLQNNDLRAIQRPQPKKLPVKNIGAIPPPPQRESNTGSGPIGGDVTDSTILLNNGTSVLVQKQDIPPLPPPRPHRHTRSSSLDLNKLKMSGPNAQHEITAQASFDIQTINDNSESGGFADFAHFPESDKCIPMDQPSQENEKHTISTVNVQPPPRPTIPSIQNNHRVSAFEVYRKPNTPRNSQSPESLQQHQVQIHQPPPPPHPQPLAQTTTVIATTSGVEYEKRVTAISETLRHVSFNLDKNISEILRHLREQNVLLLRLCNDLSEELLTVQHRKEEIRSKLESSTSSVGTVSANITGGSGSSGVHSSNV